MTIARSRQISLQDTPYYHVVSRCVRRAFLCGEDVHSGQSYQHRRQWVVDKLGQLSRLFAIGICAYAVMSNHYHLVLKVEADKAAAWDEREVAERWAALFQWPLLVRRWYQGDPLIESELAVVQQLIATWRERLHSISWFVRLLNENLARQANLEDGCKGHFWEGRFKSQALLTEAALLACMAYVDLNPIRAKLAEAPEESDYTSIKQRLDGEPSVLSLPPLLLPFSDKSHPDDLPYVFTDYLMLVDWTGLVEPSEPTSEATFQLISRLSCNGLAWRARNGCDKWHCSGVRGSEPWVTGCIASSSLCIAVSSDVTNLLCDRITPFHHQATSLLSWWVAPFLSDEFSRQRAFFSWMLH